MSFKKYFIAIVLPAAEMQQIETIKQELLNRFNLKGALKCPAHITLHRPFEWKEEKEQQLFETLNNFRFNRPFKILVKNFNFFEPRVIYAHVIPNDELNELHDKLSRHCRKELRLTNETDDLRGFHPHITIAFRDLKKPLFFELKQEFESRKIEMTLEFGAFSVLKLEERWIETQKFNQMFA